MNNIHDKTVQWETRKKYCSIINMNIQDNEQFVTPTWLMTNKGFEALSVKCDKKGKNTKIYFELKLGFIHQSHKIAKMLVILKVTLQISVIFMQGRIYFTTHIFHPR